jgi:CDP-paratose 2-epimerase
VLQPREDFETNALGTFNVLEAARLGGRNPAVVYASTNKVYGGMEDVEVVEDQTRYRYGRLPDGVPETRPLDFHSPYGCSKGAGDQYVRDYHRIYGLPTVVLRQSCIYGPRQFGVEDQGWLAWFAIAAVLGRPITIYGDGKQIRDVLHVDDLMDCFDRAVDHIDTAAGQVYNVGGGPDNTIAVWQEFGPMLEELLGRDLPVAYEDWRPGDQRVFVSNIRRATEELGWRPTVAVAEGIRRLVDWVHDHRDLLERVS